MTLTEAALIRPVQCYLCRAPMHYRGQPGFEPEVRVTVECRDDDEEYVLYVHTRCWDARMSTGPTP